jgi:predicted transcriptional regulator
MTAKEKALEAMSDKKYWSAKKLSEKLEISTNHAVQILIRLADVGLVERRQTAGMSKRFEYRIVPENKFPEVGKVRIFDRYLRGAKSDRKIKYRSRT